jgi:murein DD-endopeptidase MepM/ murein hydrolase activator NlpD
MIYRRNFIFLAAFVVLLGTLLPAVSAKDLVHIVTRGETVYSISRLYRVSQETLMRRNDISDPSKLIEGMRLVIPSTGSTPTEGTSTDSKSADGAQASGASTPGAMSYIEYTVQPNETLYSIARSKGVMFQALCDINNFPKDYMIKAGQKIKIPRPASVQSNSSSVIIMPAWAVPERPANAKAVPKNPAIRWPVSAKEIYYMHGNIGVLVSGEESESVKSLTKGTVVHASPWRGYGNVAIIEGDSGYRYLYGACQTLSVRKGDSIEPGTELGKLGIYPASGKPELVFIVSQNGSPVDPVKAPRL